MRQGQNSKRSRGRGAGRRNVPPRHQTFDSNGPSVRIRGNAYQVHEKYLALARDAGSAGDRIAAENYLQHAEHYFRIINMDNDGDGRVRGPHNDAGGRSERVPDGFAGHDGMTETSAEPAPSPAEPSEPEAAPANGVDPQPDAGTDKTDGAAAADAEPKRRTPRGNGKGRRPRAAPRASRSRGDNPPAGTNGADDGDIPLSED